MCKPNPTKLTAQEREEETYRTLYEQVKASMRAEYEASFGSTYKALYPFKSDWQVIDKAVTKMMHSQWA